MAIQSKKLIFVFVMLLIGFNIVIGVIFFGGCKGKEYSSSPNYPPYSYTGLAISSISFLDKDNGWMVAVKRPVEGNMFQSVGSLFHTITGGETWEEIKTLSSSLSQVFFLDNNIGWVVGKLNNESQNRYGKTIYFTTDAGTTWESRELTLMRYQGEGEEKIIFPDKDNGWVIFGKYWAEEIQVFKTEDGGKNWEAYETVKKFNFVTDDLIFLNKDIGWACCKSSIDEQSNPIILKTIDGGNYWQEVSPDDKEIPKDLTVGWKNSPPAYDGKIFFLDRDLGWSIANGKIYFTKDGGESWEVQSIEHRTMLLKIQFVDKDNGWVVGDGPLFRTRNGGKTWELQIGSIESPPPMWI